MELTHGRKIAFAAAAACVAFVAWLLLHDEWAEFDETVAALEAEGFVTSPDAFVAARMPPDDENGATLLMAAMERLEADVGRPVAWGVTGPWDYGAESPWEEHATDAQWDALRAFLGRAQPFFDELDRALEKPRWTFPIPRGPDGFATLPYLDTIRRTDQLLSAAALAESDPARQVSVLRRRVRFGGRLRPMWLVERMMGAAVLRNLEADLRAVVGRGDRGAASLRAEFDPVLRDRRPVAVAEAAAGEIALDVDFAHLLREGRWPGDVRKPTAADRVRNLLPESLGGGRLLRRPAEDLRDLKTLAQVARLDPATPEDLRRAVAPYRDADPQMYGPWLDRWARLMMRADVQRDLTRLGLAAAQFHETNGRWPASFAELAPLFPGGMPATSGDDRRFEMVPEGDDLRLRDAALSDAADVDDPSEYDWVLHAR